MTTKTQGWREAEALANEGCAATIEAALGLLDDVCEMLEYHSHIKAVEELLVARGRLRDERNGFLERANQARGDT